MKKEDLKEVYDEFASKLESLMPKPIDPSLYQPVKVEPIRFSNNPGTLRLNEFVDKIMQVLDGNTIEDIVNASKIVEAYVAAQSKGQYFSYPMFGGRV